MLPFYFLSLLTLAFLCLFHTARHTFGTYMLANGVSIENVAKMLGHSDTKMTRHYAKVLDQTIYEQVSKINGI